MSIDPYSSPSSNVQPPNFSTSPAVSQGVIAQLAGTKPWVRFMSVLMFLGAGLMVLVALIILVMGGTIAATAKAGSGALPAGMMTGIAILYAVLSILYIYPALKLWKYANHIGALLISSSVLDLEAALSHQRLFLKFLGIMVIVIFSLYLLIMIAAVAFGGLASLKAQGM